MKYVIYIFAFALFIWALVDQASAEPNLYLRITAVIVFFVVMMRLMDKTKSKYDTDDQSSKDEL